MEAATTGSNVTLTLSFNRKALQALKKIGRDAIVSSAFNAIAFSTSLTPISGFPKSAGDEIIFGSLGVATMTFGITAGRYAGGVLGTVVDGMRSNKDHKYHHDLAVIGGTLGGLVSFSAYQSGLWALAG